MSAATLLPNLSVLLKKTLRLLLQVAAALFLASVAWVLIYRWVAPPATWLMLDRRAHAPMGLGYYGIQEAPRYIRYQFRTLDDVAPTVPLALGGEGFGGYVRIFQHIVQLHRQSFAIVISKACTTGRGVVTFAQFRIYQRPVMVFVLRLEGA